MSEELNSTKKSNGAFIAIIMILALMLAGMAYLWSSKNTALNSCENINKENLTNMKAMEEMLSDYIIDDSGDLQKDFQAMLRTYDLLKENGSPEQNAEIDAQKALIEQQMLDLDEAIRTGRINASIVAQQRTEISGLRDIMKGYIYEIDSLHTQIYSIQNDYDEQSYTLNHTTVSRDSATQLADDRFVKIKEGQKLNAYSIKTVGMKQKLNNQMGEESKAKRVVQIRSEFTIGKNQITDAGNKVVYLRVIDPSGKTLQASSGSVTTLETGQVAFSDKKSINYQNQSIDVSVYYSLKGKVLSKGNYKVKLYCQGQLIGTDSFTLK
ncbi:MAG: hypothetical protein HRT57_07840 [Crocinitomicaceae bacterium]|nr:hypothetical protein [Crocinitomicaceae bacterium]